MPSIQDRLCVYTAAHLRLVVCLLVDLVLQLLGHPGPLQHLVLTVGQPVFEKVLADAKGDDERLPGESRTVKPTRQATDKVHPELL